MSVIEKTKFRLPFPENFDQLSYQTDADLALQPNVSIR